MFRKQGVHIVADTVSKVVAEDAAVPAEFLERTRTVLRKSFLKRFSDGLTAQIRERYGIYCLTPHPDSTLMWSHYAFNHRGICLEFGTESPLFGAAAAVNYDSAYPTWLPHRLAGEEGIRVLLSKSDDWGYENEYSVIGVRTSAVPEISGLQIAVVDDKISLPPRALKSIILGCEAPYDEITGVIKRYAPNLQIKRAVRQPSHYRLKIEPVT